MRPVRSIVRRVVRVLAYAAMWGFVTLLVGWVTSVVLGAWALELLCWPSDSTGAFTPVEARGKSNWCALTIQAFGLPVSTIPRFDWSVEKTSSIALHPSGTYVRFLVEAHPYLLLGLTAVGSLFLFLTRRRARDGRPRCACGYDLTGNVSGRCPECGRAVTPETRRRRADRARRRARAHRRYWIATLFRAGLFGLVTWFLVAAMREIELTDIQFTVNPASVTAGGVQEHRMNALLRASSLKLSYEAIGPSGTYSAKADYSTRRRSFLGLAEYAEWDRADGRHGEVVFDSKVAIGCLVAAAAFWLRWRRPYL